ncbi:MAG: lytic transglycosylase domain-containing protein [Fidelibacterota bacterium]
MIRFSRLLLIFLLIWAGAPAPVNDSAYESVRDILAQKGVPETFVAAAFASSRIAVEEGVVRRFKKPYEKKPYATYRTLFLTPPRIERGQKFYQHNQKLFQAVADSFGVDPVLLLSIVGIESNFGEHHEDFSVFNALYTIIHRIPGKADWARNQLVEFLSFCYRDHIDPHTVFGSYAGAFGYGQFIPSSFNGYAVDFDGDGRVEPFGWEDTIGSVANYLRKNGYRPGETRFHRKSSAGKAVWAYNHSENYVRAVLEFREELLKRLD